MENESENLPLKGVRVLEIATFIAAPFCGATLSEFGAEVIKVEMPEKGDPLRQWGTISECGDSLVWLSEARNKKSITLDLRKKEGAELFKKLVAKSDVVLENFRPGTLEAWGIGYEDLRKINPKLVMLRVSAYGQTGPYRRRVGYARVAHAFSGLAYLAREPGAKPVIPGSTTLADYITGLYGVVGVLLALRQRDQAGEGQYIDIALYESIFRMMDEMVPSFARSGFVREPMGADIINIVPHSHYETADGRWVAIACSSDSMFARLAKAMGQPELADDPRYQTIRQRDANRDEVNALVTAWTKSKTANELVEICEQNEMAISILYNVKDIFDDPQYKARENYISIKDDRVGDFFVPNVIPKMSETPGQLRTLGPRLGEHNKEIYEEFLGLGPDELARLREQKVI